MRTTLVKKSANAFFAGKNAKVLQEIHSMGESVIKVGETVTIIGKCKENKLHLDISYKELRIDNVEPQKLKLLNNVEEFWPIERDTFDLYNH
jgi:hypothetical protein